MYRFENIKMTIFKNKEVSCSWKPHSHRSMFTDSKLYLPIEYEYIFVYIITLRVRNLLNFRFFF